MDYTIRRPDPNQMFWNTSTWLTFTQIPIRIHRNQMPKPAKLFWISRHMKNSLSNSTTNLSSCRTTNHTQRGNNENYVCERSVQILSEHFANLKTNSSAVVWRKLYLIFKLTGFTFVNTIGYISAALQFNLKEANCIQLVLYTTIRTVSLIRSYWNPWI